MTTTEIFKEAFLQCSPFDKKGQLVNEANYYASQIICSAEQRVKRGRSRYNGSVARYYEYLKEEREFVRAFMENKYGELA